MDPSSPVYAIFTLTFVFTNTHGPRYDYCLTAKADWITWRNDVKTLEVDGVPATTTAGFVHTATTRRLHFLMDLAASQVCGVSHAAHCPRV